MAGDLIHELEQSSLLGNIPREVLGPLAETVVTEQFAGGDLIYEADAVEDTLYIVRAGIVDLRRTSQGERVAMRSVGESFGELAVFDETPRELAAVARTDCDLIAVTREAVAHVFEDDPGALMATVRNLARALTEARQQVEVVNQFVEEAVRGRTEELCRTQMEIVHRLGAAAEFRDDSARPNIFRMTSYVQVLAHAAGLSDWATRELLIAAPLHDIGKIGVPDTVLLKSGQLSESEWRIMQAHTTMGGQILADSDSPAIRLAEQVARQHHERWDGTGYPNGLSGEDIALEARICTIADVFDALTSERPYKEAWALDDALGLIDNSRGTMFDPELVKVFLAEEAAVREIHTASIEGRLDAPVSWRPDGLGLSVPPADSTG